MINYKTAFLNEYEAELEEENQKSNIHVQLFKLILSNSGYAKKNICYFLLNCLKAL